MIRPSQLTAIGIALLLCSMGPSPLSLAQEPASDAAVSNPFPDLTVPSNADAKQLQAFVKKAKSATPRNAAQYKAMQSAIRDASLLLAEQLKSKPESAEYRQAELDRMSASVALMTFLNEDEQKSTLEKVHEFLKSKKKLSLADVQMGTLAAAMLELQPNKHPAKQTYELLDELLKDDERQEMQSMRINLQASVRRLQLLGNKLELKSQALDGSTVKVDDFAGKFVVVDFFATWCEPCLMEIPRLKQKYEKYHSKGLEVVGISIDSDRQALDQYLDRADLPWPIIHDSADNPLDSLQMQFGVSQLPTVFLLNKEGTVVSLEAHGAELDRLLQMLFEAPTPAAAPEASGSQ